MNEINKKRYNGDELFESLRYETKNIYIITFSLWDSDKPYYETNIKHINYNNGHPIVLETYNTRIDATKGHSKWIKKITKEDPPSELWDVGKGRYSKRLYGKIKKINKIYRKNIELRSDNEFLRKPLKGKKLDKAIDKIASDIMNIFNKGDKYNNL
ncbi:hypothetical protein LCGC14_1323220 [marine sediment metagenome]|uniref:Uncharacterized protein n=1 Tax=marine sediment metagenome TaxID=412755 RepID=A0A0F9NL89_9ZZZZ